MKMSQAAGISHAGFFVDLNEEKWKVFLLSTPSDDPLRVTVTRITKTSSDPVIYRKGSLARIMHRFLLRSEESADLSALRHARQRPPQTYCMVR